MKQRSILRASLMVIGLALMGASCGQKAPSPQPTAPAETAKQTQPKADPNAVRTFTKALAMQNDSEQSGIVTISNENGKTSVEVVISNGGATPQPMHIHSGSCDEVGAVVYPLTNVVDGKSSTMLNVSINELYAQSPLVINVHKSEAESSVYTACGSL